MQSVDLIEKEGLRNPYRRHEILSTRRVVYQHEHTDHSYLWDMLTAARAVFDFTKDGTFEDCSNDLMLRSAVERQVEIIGEASRRVSEGFRSQHPEIPWSKGAVCVQRSIDVESTSATKR